MNRNSEKVAMICVGFLLIIFTVIGIIMTVEHFEWIETNLLGG